MAHGHPVVDRHDNAQVQRLRAVHAVSATDATSPPLRSCHVPTCTLPSACSGQCLARKIPEHPDPDIARQLGSVLGALTPTRCVPHTRPLRAAASESPQVPRSTYAVRAGRRPPSAHGLPQHNTLRPATRHPAPGAVASTTLPPLRRAPSYLPHSRLASSSCLRHQTGRREAPGPVRAASWWRQQTGILQMVYTPARPLAPARQRPGRCPRAGPDGGWCAEARERQPSVPNGSRQAERSVGQRVEAEADPRRSSIPHLGFS